jgi:hypothetical protein
MIEPPNKGPKEQPLKVGERAWPRITLVTAVYNGERFLGDTIRSVVNQGYPNLEYIIVNDGSTDATVEIIKKYEQHLAGWINQSNRGLYAALNTGFERSTGEVLGWLNSSDMLHTHGLLVVGSVFSAFPDVEWVTGRPTNFSSEGWPIYVFPSTRWSRHRFLAGANRYIQQESTFWRRSLWEKAGGRLSTKFRVEGDFELWVRFFRHARLYSVNALIGGWRDHSDSLSHSNIDRYNRTCDEIIEQELQSSPNAVALKLFRKIDRTVKCIPKLRGIWQLTVIKALYQMPGPDWPPFIEYQGTWRMR